MLIFSNYLVFEMLRLSRSEANPSTGNTELGYSFSIATFGLRTATPILQFELPIKNINKILKKNVYGLF